MQWAIVSTQPMMLSYWVWDEASQQQIWTTSEMPTNTVMNLVVYDGVSPYTPPDNTVLMQVDDSKQVGDLAS